MQAFVGGTMFTAMFGAFFFYLMCVVIVSFDPKERWRLQDIKEEILSILLGIPVFMWCIYGVMHGINPLESLGTGGLQFADGLTDYSILFAPISLLIMLICLVLILVSPIGPVIVIVATLGFAALLWIRLTPIIDTLVAVPGIAVRNVWRGVMSSVHSVIYFFVEPPALRSLKDVVQSPDSKVEDYVKAGEKLHEELEKAQNASSEELSDTTLQAHAHHYEKLAKEMSERRLRAKTEYVESIKRVADELRKDAEDRHRAGGSRGDEQKRKG